MRSSHENVGHRHARLEELVLEELRGLFRDDVSDPALRSVWITSIVLSVDYRHARVHYVDRGVKRGAVHGADHAGVRPLEGSLQRAAPFLRARLSEAIDLKRVPDLSFVLDGATPDES